MYNTVTNSGIQIYRNSHGEFHREDGPAIIYPNGSVEWYLNGYQYIVKEMPLCLFLVYCRHKINYKY